MKIIDLNPDYENAYLNCLEEWSDEMKEAGDHKECWFRKHKADGLRVKLAVDDDGTAVGMIQYLPVEDSIVDGKSLYFIPCIWVHGHKEGVGNQQGKGAGTMLLNAAEEDARELGAKGMAAWGVSLPFWMKASWYKKHGYKKADKDSIRLLVWKPFVGEASAPTWVRQKKQVPSIPGKVSVTGFHNGWCQVENIMFERARRACDAFDDRVVFIEIDTSDEVVFEEWGISDSIYIDGKKLRHGPPLSLEKIEKAISKSVSKLPK